MHRLFQTWWRENSNIILHLYQQMSTTPTGRRSNKEHSLPRTNPTDQFYFSIRLSVNFSSDPVVGPMSV